MILVNMDSSESSEGPTVMRGFEASPTLRKKGLFC